MSDEEERSNIIVYGCMCGYVTEPTTSHWYLHNYHPCPACGHNLNAPYQFMGITHWMEDNNDDHTEKHNCWCFGKSVKPPEYVEVTA